MKFVIYYANGTCYRGNNAIDANVAPADAVQVIVMPNPDGGIMTATKSDYYIYDQRPGDSESRWYGADISGLFQYLRKLGTVKFG